MSVSKTVEKKDNLCTKVGRIHLLECVDKKKLSENPKAIDAFDLELMNLAKELEDEGD